MGTIANQNKAAKMQAKLEKKIAEIEAILESMPQRGLTSEECQKTALKRELRGFEMCVNGITANDFVPNEYSN